MTGFGHGGEGAENLRTVRCAEKRLGRNAAAPIVLRKDFMRSSSLDSPLNRESFFNVRDFGAVGDGVALDSPAINAAIEAAAREGGGTVTIPPGTYLSFSVRLKSNITLVLESGATLLAATPAAGFGHYDDPEPNDWGDKLQYQDFGHSHLHNSLIWGDDLENIAITGTGLIDGKGLTKHVGYVGLRNLGPNGTMPEPMPTSSVRLTLTTAYVAPGAVETQSKDVDASSLTQGNKAVGLKNCRNVLLRDFSILNGGHFGVLASGVRNLTVDNLKVDSNRGGFDFDCCRNVRVSNCSVNTPDDDAIALKSSYAHGELRACENITIVNCLVSGYDIGTLLDGTHRKTVKQSPDGDGPTGRIKIGTESNGDFRNITIANCIFDRSRGLALESVDGATIEDVVVSNLVMRDVSSSPIFIRLGKRARGPANLPIGAIRRIKIGQITASQSDGRFPVLLAGLPGQCIEDVTLDNIEVRSLGGLTLEQVAQQPDALVNVFFLKSGDPKLTGPRDPFAVPLHEKGYPEPSMFGLLPAGALYARYVKGLSVRNVRFTFDKEDTRPRAVIEDASGIQVEACDFSVKREGAIVLRRVSDFVAHRCRGIVDTHRSAEVTAAL